MTDISQQIRGQIYILKDFTLFKDSGDGTAFGVKQKRMDSMTPGLHDLLYALWHIQAYLILLHFTLLHFFYKLKICSNFPWTKSINVSFPTSFSQVVSLCHIIVMLAIVQTFSLLLICLLQWSVIIYITIMICRRFVEYYNFQLVVNIC